MKIFGIAAAAILATGLAASAQTLEELKDDGTNPDNILTYGMGYHQHRYSLTVSQISTPVPSRATWATR